MIRRLTALCVLCVPALLAGTERYQGKVISRIEFDPVQQPLPADTLLSLLPLKAGDTLSSAALRTAIQKLYGTGEYADIAVDASLDQGLVVLRFLTRPQYFIGHIGIAGVPEPPSGGELTTSTKLQLGTEYSDTDPQRAIGGLTDVLRRNGFYNARITPEILRDPRTQQVQIYFKIDSGARARFSGVKVTGNPLRTERAIVVETGWKPFRGMLRWRALTEDRLQSGLDNVRGWYQRHNHMLANIRLTSLDYDRETNRVLPNIDIQPGPEVQVNVTGAKISSDRLRSLLPVYQERAVDRDLLVEGQHDLSTYMQSKGYFDASAEVATERRPDGDEVIDYTVDLGGRHKLVHLEIDGNKYFQSATLRERMYLIPATRLRYRYGRFSQEYLTKDVAAIHDLYRSNGFRNVEVTSEQKDDYRGQKNDIGVLIHVHEGPQWFVTSLQIEGISETDQHYLRGILHSTEGQPYSDVAIATDRDSILDYYYNQGYPNAKFDFLAVTATDPNHVELTFRIDPGARIYVRDVVITGLQDTKLDIVKQRISLHSGDPVSQTVITESQKRLYDLDIFAKVNTALQNPEGDEPTKYVLYSMEEARRYSINFGFGAEIARIGGGTTDLNAPAGVTGFSPRVSFGISRLNFLGLGQTLNLQTRVSTLEQRALLTYFVPQIIANPNLNLQVTGLFDISKDVRTFSARREESSIQLGRKLSKANTMQFRYTFRQVNILGTPLVTPELIPLLSQPVRVGLLGASFIQDRRDDPTDAHRGVYNTIDLSLAANAFGSQTGFGRIVARNSTYHRVTKSLIFARSTYFGTIQRYAGLPEIRLAERFFSGGSNSQRAFPDNQAGPRDLETGFPIGGGALLTNSLELRFPVIGDTIGGVLFNDMGNVYSSLGSISLRWRQNGLSDFDYGVQAFGFGVRYKTPIGPVRMDLSLSPNSPRFFGFTGTYNQLIFGGGTQTVQRINVFQFHFSLGQAF